MSDKSELDASQAVKVVGSNPDGTEQGYIESDLKASGERGMHVIAEVKDATGGGNVSSPVFSKKLRLDADINDVALNANTGAFVDIFNYSGSGKFVGFNAEFNNDGVQVKLTIDGDNIFTENGDPWHDLGELKSFAGKSMLANRLDVSFGVDFAPEYPIVYSTNVIVQARANSAATNRKKTQIIVKLTKET